VAALGLVVVKIQEARRNIYVGQPRVPEHPRDPTAQLFMDAKIAIRAGQWTVAKARLLELQNQRPDYPGLKDYLERVEKEIPNQEHLDTAQKALAEKNLNMAQLELEAISADTTMFEQVGKLKRELQEATEAQAREAQAREAQQPSSDPVTTDVIQDPAPPPPHGEKSAKAANALYQRAVKAKSAHKWALAVEYAHQALQEDPHHEGALRLIAELKEKAKGILTSPIEASHDGDPEEAIAKFRTVVEMTEAGDPLHEKAKAWLEKMER
jgi:tetratricopeptide (TPR) repeat protein